MCDSGQDNAVKVKLEPTADSEYYFYSSESADSSDEDEGETAPIEQPAPIEQRHFELRIPGPSVETVQQPQLPDTNPESTVTVNPDQPSPTGSIRAPSQPPSEMSSIRFEDPENETIFPPHLLKFLETWHRENGKKKPPPCTLWWNSEVPGRTFNRKCEEARIVRYAITKPSSYVAMVFHSPGEPEKLVANAYGSRSGCAFLAAWTGRGETFESKCCAVRIFDNQVRCSEEVWQRAPCPPRVTTCPNPRPASSPALTVASSDESPPPRRLRKRGRPAILGTNATPNTPARTASVEDRDATEHGTEEASRPTSPAKRSRLETGQTSAISSGISFRFYHYRLGSQTIQRKSLDDCQTGAQLFALAKAFFHTIPSLEKDPVSQLSCKFSVHLDQKRLLSKDSEGDFKFLIEDAKELQSAINEHMFIDVSLPKFSF